MNETYEEKRIREAEVERAFQTTMEKVAGCMGWTWSNLDRDGNPWHDGGYLTAAHEGKIHIRLDTWHKRISISACYPNGHDTYGIKPISITVSPTKEPARIAKDIQSRVLPEYLVNLEKAKEQIKKHNEYEVNRRAMMERIAIWFGVEIQDNGSHDLSVYPKDSGPIYKIEPSGENEVKFTVECSAEMALRVFGAIC